MKKYLLFIISLTISNFLCAQNTATTIWTDAFGLQDTVLKIPTVLDGTGNLYVAGSTIDSLTGPNIAIKKYDQYGEPLFTINYTGTGNNRDQATALAVDINQNLIVAGFSYINSTNSYDFLVLKYDSTGSLLWTYTYNGTGSAADIISAVVIDTTNIYITGASIGSATLFDYLTIKLNSSGSQLWLKTYNYLGNDIPFAIEIADNNIFVNGGSQSSITNYDYARLQYTPAGTTVDTLRSTGVGFNKVTQAVSDANGNVYITGAVSTISNGFDFKTIKLDSQGFLNWTRTFDNTSHQDDIANAITIDVNGNVFVTGQTENSIGNTDYCTIKYDSLGTVIWTRYYDNNYNDEPKAITMDIDNNVIVTGSSNNASNKDFATLAYSTDGDTLWVKRFNGLFNGQDYATSIIEKDGLVYVTGQSQINGTQYQNVTIAYGQANIKEIPDIFNEPKSANHWFIPNQGQLQEDTINNITYYVPNHNPALYFNVMGLSYVFNKIDNDTATTDTLHRIDMKFVRGASYCRNDYYPSDELSTHYNNYYLPSCPNGVIDVYGHNLLFVEDLYSGIDLYYSSNTTGLKHYFVVHPNANIKAIGIEFEGADSISTQTGKYAIHSSIGKLEYDSLIAYEMDAAGNIISGTSQAVQLLADSNGVFHFTQFAYNTSNYLILMAKQKVSVNPPQNNFNINWCTYWGNGSDDNFTNLTHDFQNNVIYCGFTTSAFFPDPIGISYPGALTNSGLSDVIIIKINDQMEPKWLAYLGGSNEDKANSIAAKSNGNLVCVGSTKSYNLPLLTPDSALVDSFPANSFDDWWLLSEFDKNGNLLWSTPFSNGAVAKDVAVTQIGKEDVTFVVGEAYHTMDIIDVPGSTTYPTFQGGYNRSSYMIRLESVGVRTWATYLGYKLGSANAVAINRFNQLFVGGISEDINPQSVPGPDTSVWAPNKNVYVHMYDVTSLVLKWADAFGSNREESLNDITVDNYGNCFAVGGAEDDFGSTHFNSSDTTDFMDAHVIIDDRDGMIIQHDSAGVRKWLTYFGHAGFDEIKTAIVDNNGNLYLAGLVEYDGFYAPYQQPPNFYVQSTKNDPNLGFKDSYIARFNSNCELEWTTYFGTKYEDVNDQINSLMQCNQRLYFCGFVDGGGYDSLLIPVQRYDWDLSTNDYYQENSNSPYTATEAFAGCFDTLFISGISKIEKKNDSKILLYPNPANDQVNIKIVSNVNELATLTVFDSKGELVLNTLLKLQTGINNFRINISKLTPSLYFVSINSNQIHENTKFIKQ